MNYREKYEMWLKSPLIDLKTKQELLALEGNEKEIEDRFYKDLEFGTGGLRGVIGAGSNRMNQYTVAKATQGLANYICKKGEKAKEKGVVIAYDSRRKSPDFALVAALVLCANGIRTYLYSELQPTPILSFSVRDLGATAGIVITASHNPPEYNGYKVYWSDGGQVPPHLDNEIISEVNQVKNFEDIKNMTEGQALDQGLLRYIGEEVVDRYVERVKSLCINKDLVQKEGMELKVIYTPIHGSGNKPVRRVLKELGFEKVSVVPEQEMPDPDFSTVSYPNPEEKEVFDLAIKLAKEKGADLIIGTDPDCDRVGVVVKNRQGEYITLTGNQTGALLVHYCLSALKSMDKLPENGCIVKTIVTSEMGRKIADSFGIATINTLTGFKFIGEKIKEFEETGSHTFILGYEESYGYLAGSFVRDKDAVIASMLICEMAAYYQSRGMTLYEGLLSLWKEYGYYKESLKSVQMYGKEGMEKIRVLMDNLRNSRLKEIGGFPVARIEDYLRSTAYDMESGNNEKIALPVSNVLKYIFKEGSWFCIRPSGTEPKVKLYFSAVGSSQQEADEKNNALMDAVSAMLF
ncbi:MAG TPA: phospho-sugar mutase [Clostridiales bacterium]|nr:phospho-sugar mutase [Clostridiales bacterium]